MTSSPAPVFALSLLLGALVLSGCSSAPETTDDPSVAEETPASQTAERDDATAPAGPVTCADIAPLAAPITGSFAFSEDDSTEERSGATCVWINDAVASTSTDLADYAALSVGIDDLAWTEEELSTLPGATDDPRAAALDGRVLVLGDGDTLGEVGSVQVLFPKGSVTIVATGALLTASPDTAIPIDAVIDVAANVAALRR